MKNVVFLGGSITEGYGALKPENGYASLVAEWLEERLGGIREINLGSAATGSEFAVFRLREQLLDVVPDYLFVEFAVNDRTNRLTNAAESYENLLRNIFRFYPECRVISLEFPMKRWKSSQRLHQKIASYYGVPSIDLQTPVRKEVLAGSYVWEEIGADDVHPNDKGHRLYADKIIEALSGMELENIVHNREKAPLTSNLFLYPGILSPQDTFFMGHWQIEETDAVYKTKTAAVSQVPGDFFEVCFQGNYISVLNYTFSDCGRLECVLDEKQVFVIESYRSIHYFSFTPDWPVLSMGNHTLFGRIADSRHEKSSGTMQRIGGFSINEIPSHFGGFVRKQENKRMSIIVACPDQAGDLSYCLKSLLNQTAGMEVLELIFSYVPHSGEEEKLLEQTEQTYEDSVILLKEEEGLSREALWNSGLSYAAGRYVLFLEETDQLCREACETLFNTAQEQECDFLQFGGYSEEAAFLLAESGRTASVDGELEKGGAECRQKGLEGGLKVWDFVLGNDTDRKKRKRLLQSVYGELSCHASKKLYRRNLLERVGVGFLENAADGELMFVYPLLFEAERVGITEKKYLLHPGTSGKGKTEYDLTAKNLLHFLYRKDFVNSYYEEIELFFLIRHCIHRLERFYRKGEKNLASKVMIMQQMLIAYFPDYRKNSYFAEKKFALVKDLMSVFSQDITDEILGNLREEWLKEASLLPEIFEEEPAYSEDAAFLSLEDSKKQQQRIFGKRFLLIQASAPYHYLKTYVAQLAEALERLGNDVLVMDTALGAEKELEWILDYPLDVVITFNHLTFQLNYGGQPLYEMLGTENCSVCLEHPVYFWDQLSRPLSRCHHFFLDQTHAEFAETYLPGVQKTEVLTLGGWEGETESIYSKRQFPVVFLGTYKNPEEILKALENRFSDSAVILRGITEIYKKQPNLTLEEVICLFMKSIGLEISKEERLGLTANFAQVEYYIRAYFRQQVLESLLVQGIQVHVYGAYWETYTGEGRENLIVHGPVYHKDSSKVLENARIVLNISPHYKKGIHQRVLQAMSCGALCISDRSRLLEQEFTEGKELLLYSLTELSGLAKLVKTCLSQEAETAIIAEAGRKKVRQRFSWEQCARTLLQALDGQ